MKISLSQDEVDNLAASGGHAEELAQAIAGCKIGDWESKHALERLFASLISMLAEKRAGSDATLRSKLMERGREGLYRAAKRFSRRDSVRHFHVFALDYIEAAMDKPVSRLLKIFR